MVCKQCEELISDYIDGSLELGQQVQIERHLADCEPCRAVRDDLLQIIHFSHQLPQHSPSGVLWTRIQTEVAQQRGAWFRALPWWTWLKTRHIDVSIPQLAATAAVLVIAVSTAVLFSRKEAPTQNTTSAGIAGTGGLQATPLSNSDFQQIEMQINRLSESVELRKVEWDPELRSAFERNLLYIDQSLAECRHQLNGNPTDDLSHELMLNAYREKVRLLEGFEHF
ncbi:MAG TPA: zf-HC2 domain-containing protein [Blastocatellia bacterium]|nr:zf-HC2 domain-containing protein [Blastocatellia bacterium]